MITAVKYPGINLTGNVECLIILLEDTKDSLGNGEVGEGEECRHCIFIFGRRQKERENLDVHKSLLLIA